LFALANQSASVRKIERKLKKKGVPAEWLGVDSVELFFPQVRALKERPADKKKRSIDLNHDRLG